MQAAIAAWRATGLENAIESFGHGPQEQTAAGSLHLIGFESVTAQKDSELRKQFAVFLVRVTGLEPARLTAEEPKSTESTNSTIPAYKIVSPVFTRRGIPGQGTEPDLQTPAFIRPELLPGGAKRLIRLIILP